MKRADLGGFVASFANQAPSACGSACGAAKPEEKPSACGSACGAQEPAKPSACGSACGAAEPKKEEKPSAYGYTHDFYAADPQCWKNS